MAADFFLVDMERIEMVGAQFDPASVLSTVGLKGSVDYTVVDGRIVVRDGRLACVDEHRIVEKANAVAVSYTHLRCTYASVSFFSYSSPRGVMNRLQPSVPPAHPRTPDS